MEFFRFVRAVLRAKCAYSIRIHCSMLHPENCIQLCVCCCLLFRKLSDVGTMGATNRRSVCVFVFEWRCTNDVKRNLIGRNGESYSHSIHCCSHKGFINNFGKWAIIFQHFKLHLPFLRGSCRNQEWTYELCHFLFWIVILWIW